MLKLSLKEGEYVNIGDDIRVVFVGGNGKHGRLLRLRSLPIVRLGGSARIAARNGIRSFLPVQAAVNVHIAVDTNC